MLKIKKIEFDIQSSVIELKQRNYQGDSIVSMQLNTNFYPAMVDNKIISGTVTVTIDILNMKKLSDIENKTFEGESCKIVISLSKNGKWEIETCYDCKISFNKKENNKINFSLNCNKLDCELDTVGTILSLYTISTKEKELKEIFDMNEFYDIPIIKEINKKEILKFIVKNK